MEINVVSVASRKYTVTLNDREYWLVLKALEGSAQEAHHKGYNEKEDLRNLADEFNRHRG